MPPSIFWAAAAGVACYTKLHVVQGISRSRHAKTIINSAQHRPTHLSFLLVQTLGPAPTDLLQYYDVCAYLRNNCRGLLPHLKTIVN
jgi:hypothetical protein